MKNLAYTETYKGYIINIYFDSGYESPREWSNVGHMVYFHSRYNLGDKHDFTVEGIKDFIKRKNVISLPLYLYDHSGITMNTTGFHCPWDSGQVGYIYITHEDIKREFTGVKSITKRVVERAIKVLKGEVKTYDDYLTGNVFGFEIVKKTTCEHCEAEDEKQIDSCWGYYGDYDDYMLKECRDNIDRILEEGDGD